MNPRIRQAEAGSSLPVLGQLSLHGAFQAELQSNTLLKTKRGNGRRALWPTPVTSALDKPKEASLVYIARATK